MPASGSSSELSSHQMAIRSHPGVQKMPASGISSEVSAHQMAISGHGNEDAPLGEMGCFSTWFQVLPSRFLCSSSLSFFYLSLRSLCTASFCPVCVYRSCRPENSCEGVPTQAFGAFLREVFQAPLPGLLEPSPAVQMYDVCCGLASYGSYVSDLVICMVMPFSSGLHVFTEFAFMDTWNFAKAPSSHRGAEGRWRCRRLLVAFSGGLQQTLSLGPCAATVQRAPSHNRWGVSETTLPVKTQGRTLDCPFNLLPPRIVAGWLVMCRCQVCNKTAVALVATGPRRVAL